MTTKVIAVRGRSTTHIVFDLANDQLVNPTEIDGPSESDGTLDLRLSANDKYLIGSLDVAETLHAALWNGGDVGAWGAGTAANNEATVIVPHPIDETVFAALSTGSFNEIGVYQIDSGDLSISQIDSATVTSFGAEGNRASWSDDGTRLAAGNSTNLYLFSWDGTNLSELDTLSLFPGSGDRVQPYWIPGTSRIFVGNDNHDTIALVDATGDSLTSLDTASQTGGFTRSAVSPNGLYALHGGRPGASTARIWPLGETSFGTAVDLIDECNEAVWIGNNRFITIEDDGSNQMPVRLYSWDGTTATQIQQENTSVDNAPRAHITSGIPTLPPTVQTQFETTYADVSGRDPLPTALTSRDPAKNLVNYLVGIYAGNNPRIVRKPVLIQYGELDKVSPAPPAGKLCREIWIEDPRDPNFKMGRRAVILGRSGGADPGTVELTLFIADNAESFVEPS